MSHLRGPGAVRLLPEENPEVAQRQQAAEHIADSVLQRAAHQQRVVQERVVEHRYDLHILWNQQRWRRAHPYHHDDITTCIFIYSIQQKPPPPPPSGQFTPLISAGVSLTNGRGSGESTNTASLLNTRPNTAMAGPLLWVWSRKFTGLRGWGSPGSLLLQTVVSNTLQSAS